MNLLMLGGCDFAADPSNSALEQPVFWSVQSDPGSVLLTNSPTPVVENHVSTDDLWPHLTNDDRASLIQLDFEGERYNVTLEDRFSRHAQAALVILDEMTLDRLTTVARFWNATQGKHKCSDPRITRQRQARAREMLRAADGSRGGATYRTIAQHLYPNHVHDAATFVGSPLRETIIRLVRDANRLIGGDYRKFLRRPRRKR